MSASRRYGWAASRRKDAALSVRRSFWSQCRTPEGPAPRPRAGLAATDVRGRGSVDSGWCKELEGDSVGIAERDA